MAKTIRVLLKLPTKPIDPVVEYMRKKRIPLTRENYRALAFALREPSVEEEVDVPDFRE